ncbi:hypothetical protein M5F03_09455 [Acinetobacter sp. ANC 5579]|uniref:hypothetical protein n=1 Tax=Acinetobacter amyesii TaxID=2942470 RepID=UPI0020C06FB4|nr:hypothetical protein [Acinetobacter amyesii]MCL6235385.1 hypothetical protein [Acinetobacter amyesii]
MYFYHNKVHETIEYDYAIVDPNLNADYFYEIEDKLISLAPNYANKNMKVFPYLLRLNRVDQSLISEIFKQDKKNLRQGKNTFLPFIFKSIPTREPDIVEHLKKKLVYELNGRFFLYRFFDPKIWIQLNYFKSSDFIELNKYFKNIRLNIYDSYCFFNEYLGEKDEYDCSIDYELLIKINICNNFLSLIQFKPYSISDYYKKIVEVYNSINLIEHMEIEKTNDKVAILYHMELLGKNYIYSDFFEKLLISKKGYEQASKLIENLMWQDFFIKNNIFDEELKNKVMYGY